MAFVRSFTLILAISTFTVNAGLVQTPNLMLPPDAATHRAAVQTIFTKSYEAYKQFAFGHDSLCPLSKGFSDDRNGWGATIVDSLSTMHIMGLDDLFAEAVNFSSKIDFSVSHTPEEVSVFETTIRYLAGLLSAYELTNNQYPALLQKSQQVADKLAFAWNGSNDLPFRLINFSTNLPNQNYASTIADAGSLMLEWATLSKYTGNQTYFDLADKAFRHIISLPAPFPGLPAQFIDSKSGHPMGGSVSWGGGSDSYFEYLIKYARLSNTEDNIFADAWLTAVDSSIKYLLHTSTVGNHTYLADVDDAGNVLHVSSHLACFHGGNWLFGGKLLNNQTIVDYGLQLIDTCWNTYASTPTGIGPETFGFISSDGDWGEDRHLPSPAQLDFNAEHGFYVTRPRYIMRPEVLESNFYAFRVTGDAKYLDRAASAIASFNKHLSVEHGFAGLNDVTNVTAGYSDETESFWFAEVLKYLYLTFDDPQHISLDEWVFNTEAHPFKAPVAKELYGTGADLSQKVISHHQSSPIPVS